MANVIEVLQERGFIDSLTGDEIKQLAEKPLKVYCGFDPTSDSLHLGNLVAIMGLAWFQRFGHTPVPLVGGATGMIGDPSGKSEERNLLDQETLLQNIQGIKKNLQAVIDFRDSKTQPVLLNNFDWLKDFSMIEFLRSVGKYFRIGPMLGKESVRKRLDSEEGLSYTEFSYQLLQAYDFLYLYRNLGVSLQIGGADQWGNITAGIDLIRRVEGAQTFGMTFPLLTTADGKKFGKTESGAVWLSSEKLSPYHFYQYLFRVSDQDVIRLLCMLTFLDMKEVKEIEASMKRPGYCPNSAQRRLAEEVTRIVHGEAGVEMALKATAAAKPGSQAVLEADQLEGISSDIPTFTVAKEEALNQKIIDLLSATKALASKSEARRLIKNGGLYMNNQKVLEEDKTVSQNDLIGNRLILFAMGKKNKCLIRILESND